MNIVLSDHTFLVYGEDTENDTLCSGEATPVKSLNNRLKGSFSTFGLNKLHILEPSHKKLLLPVTFYLFCVFLRFLIFHVWGLRGSLQPFSVPFASPRTVLLQKVAFSPPSVPAEGLPLTYALWRETIEGWLFIISSEEQKQESGRYLQEQENGSHCM